MYFPWRWFEEHASTVSNVNISCSLALVIRWVIFLQITDTPSSSVVSNIRQAYHPQRYRCRHEVMVSELSAEFQKTEKNRLNYIELLRHAPRTFEACPNFNKWLEILRLYVQSMPRRIWGGSATSYLRRKQSPREVHKYYTSAW